MCVQMEADVRMYAEAYCGFVLMLGFVFFGWVVVGGALGLGSPED